MKKIIIFILCCVMVLSLIGCSVENPQNTNETTNSFENNAIENPPTNKETEQQNILNDEKSNNLSGSDEGYVVSANMDYLTFENACELATDVVVATFTGSRPYGASFTEYSFTVKDRLLGEAPNEINVYAMDVNILVEHESVGAYNEQELFLEHNTDYLLVLDHRVSVYNEVDIYQFICNIVIDVSDVSDSTMYNQSIVAHSANFDFSKTDTLSTLTYIEELVKDNQPSSQPIKNPEVSDIKSSSTDILIVTVGKCEKTVITDFRNTGFYSCTVNETLKGNISAGDTIQILFRNADVEEGDKIIVALNNYDDATYYRLTSLNSIFSVDEKTTFLFQNETP